MEIIMKKVLAPVDLEDNYDHAPLHMKYFVAITIKMLTGEVIDCKHPIMNINKSVFVTILVANQIYAYWRGML